MAPILWKTPWGERVACTPQFSYYGNGRLALILVDPFTGERVATASVNVPEVDLEDNEIAIKDYSENQGVLDALVDAGMVALTDRAVASGFVTLPIVRLLADPVVH